MEQIADAFKPALAVLLGAVAFWHLFSLGKWLANAGDRFQARRRRPQGKDDPSKNASIEPR